MTRVIKSAQNNFGNTWVNLVEIGEIISGYSDQMPSVALLGGKIFMSRRGTQQGIASNDTILFYATFDLTGKQIGGWNPVTDKEVSWAPSFTVYWDTLYAVYQSSDKYLYYSIWNSQQNAFVNEKKLVKPGVWNNPTKPACVIYDSVLHVIQQGGDKCLWHCRYDLDNNVELDAVKLDNRWSSGSPVSITTYRETIFLTFFGKDESTKSEKQLYMQYDGVDWSPSDVVPGLDTQKAAAEVFVSRGLLHFLYPDVRTGNDPSELRYVTFDGGAFSPPQWAFAYTAHCGDLQTQSVTTPRSVFTVCSAVG